MRLQTNGREYPCNGYQASEASAYFSVYQDLPETLGETATLLRDDGFVLAEHRVGDFLRWYAAGTSLVLTNQPEPGPAPEPTPPEPQPPSNAELAERLGQVDETVIGLYETQAQQDEAIIEIYENRTINA